MPNYDVRPIELWDNVWQKLKNAKQVTYDVFVPLRKLERERNPDTINRIYKELWDNLVHDGQIGSASLLAIPHIVRIARDNRWFDANLLKLCATIELQHGFKVVIRFPYGYNDYEGFYRSGLNSLKDYILEHIGDDIDEPTFRYASACLAAIRQDVWLGKALLLLDDVEKQVNYVDSIEPRDNWPDRIKDECEYLGY